MIGAIVGYARTSTIDQRAGLDAQVEELKAAGCTRVFAEQLSGVDVERPKLKEALTFLREGDTFCVTRPERLARSTIDLLKIVQDLTGRGVKVRILSMGLNTDDATGRLILTVLAAVGSFERELMLERQRHGIRRAQQQGRYKGRKPTARARAKEIRALKTQGLGVSAIKKQTGVSRSSIYRVLREMDGSAAPQRV